MQPAALQLTRQVLNGPTMGTRYAAVFFAFATPAGLAAALQAAVDEVDAQMSTWKPHSDLMRFNGAPVGEWIAVPARLMEVVITGLTIGRISGGAFDIGTGDLVRAWGFNGGAPDAAALRRLADTPRQRADQLLEVDEAGLRLRKLGPIALDLSGIAKGYGVDRLAETLETFGIRSYLVSIDGEVRAGAPKPDGTAWRVAVEKPDPAARDVAGVVELSDGALATSGTYRHSVEVGGTAYSHTMDPRTGRPVENDVASATVRASTCMLADAWATVMMVLGEEGLELVSQNGVEAMLALREA